MKVGDSEETASEGMVAQAGNSQGVQAGYFQLGTLRWLSGRYNPVTVKEVQSDVSQDGTNWLLLWSYN